jgi:predicted TIM-barrel fold metal-dependent hydrolase
VRLAVRFPAVRIVMLHLGMDTDLVAHTPEIVKDSPNLILDTSCTPDLPYPVFVNPVRCLGAARVMFGSDGPVCSVEANLAKLEVARTLYDLTADERQRILGGTAAEVFRIG